MALQYTTYYNPATSFVAEISGGFVPGRLLTINGFVPPDADCFRVDLRHGGDVALHVKPHFGDNKVVRNTMKGGKWETEEKDGPMPFERGQPFTMTIFCEKNNFIIIVNGRETYKFAHRFDHLEKIDKINIHAKVTLSTVTI